MNMLDPTTLPDPENYNKEDVEHLYVRRFKKDVISDVSGHFPDRKVTQEKCTATAAEEAAFDCLTNLHLVMDVHRRGTNAGLFKTLLEKSLFSSPAAWTFSSACTFSSFRSFSMLAFNASNLLSIDFTSSMICRVYPAASTGK